MRRVLDTLGYTRVRTALHPLLPPTHKPMDTQQQQVAHVHTHSRSSCSSSSNRSAILFFPTPWLPMRRRCRSPALRSPSMFSMTVCWEGTSKKRGEGINSGCFTGDVTGRVTAPIRSTPSTVAMPAGESPPSVVASVALVASVAWSAVRVLAGSPWRPARSITSERVARCVVGRKAPRSVSHKWVFKAWRARASEAPPC